jgi:cell division protein ZapA
MENKVKVNIYGNEYNIKGDADPEYIQKLAEYINKRMVETGRNIANGNVLQIAILTALNIADEYFQLQEMKGDTSGALEQKAKALISMLEEGIIGDVFSGIEAVPAASMQ